MSIFLNFKLSVYRYCKIIILFTDNEVVWLSELVQKYTKRYTRGVTIAIQRSDKRNLNENKKRKQDN